MHAVSHQIVAVPPGAENIPVFLWRFSGPFLKSFRKIAVVRESRVHTDRKQFIVRLDHSLAGIIKPHRCDIFLSALVCIVNSVEAYLPLLVSE